MKRPFLTIGLSMLCAMYALFFLPTAFTVAAAAILFTAAAVCVFFRRKEASVLLLLSISGMLAFFCFSYTEKCIEQPALLYCGENISVSGTLKDYPEKNNDRYAYTLTDCTIAGEETSVTLQLTDTALYSCRPGDRLHFIASEIYANSERDSIYYLSTMAQGFSLRAYTNAVTVEKTGAVSFLYAARELRHSILESLQRRLPQTAANITGALMLGYEDSMDEQTQLIFRLSGLSHLFAVSGFHVSFWTGLVVNAFGGRKNKRTVCIAACIFLVFFMALTGFSVSVCRAGIMLLTVFAGHFVRRDADSLNSMGLAVSILLLNPYAAADVSLLLSAGATASILLSAPPIEKYILQPLSLRIKNKNLQALLLNATQLFLQSFFVCIGILPLTSICFGSISVLTPLANVFCMLPAQLTMLFGTAAQAVHRIPYLSDFLFFLTESCCHFLLRMTDFFASVPFSRLTLPFGTVVIWAAACLLLLVFCFSRFRRQQKKQFTVAIACCCVLTAAANIGVFCTRDTVTMRIQQVGNASCFTLYDRHGNAAVFGCGGNDYSAQSLQNHLLSHGNDVTQLLLIPRSTQTEQANAALLTQLLSPRQIIAAPNATHGQADDEVLLLTEEAVIQLWENCTVYYKNTDSFSGAHISVNGKNIVLCFSPSSDFSDAQTCFQSGDVFIGRQAVPQTLDTAQFDEIILSTDKNKNLYYFPSALADKIRTTADEGTIERTLR